MKCLLDMDGVLTNFVKAAHEVHGIDLPYWWPPGEYRIARVMGLTDKVFWSKLNDFDFWANMEWMSDGKEIFECVLDYFGQDNICICTSPSLSPQAAAGKLAWIQRELPELSRQFMITPAKHFAAHTGVVLIDDQDNNILKFRTHGGYTVLVPRVWNSEYAKSFRTVPELTSKLRNFFV